MKKSVLKKIVKEEIQGVINEDVLDPYNVAKDLVGTERRNQVFEKWGIDKNDYNTSAAVMKEVMNILKSLY